MEYRGYKIETILAGPAGHRIRRIGSGDMHDSLKGVYTSPKFAQNDIDRVENDRPKESVVLQDLPKRTTKDAIPRDK